MSWLKETQASLERKLFKQLRQDFKFATDDGVRWLVSVLLSSTARPDEHTLIEIRRAAGNFSEGEKYVGYYFPKWLGRYRRANSGRRYPGR